MTEENARYMRVQSLSPSENGALEQLFFALGDESWRVRKVAVERARLFDSDGVLINALVLALFDSENAGLRSAASDVLKEKGRAAEKGLIAASRDEDHDVRKFAVELLGSIDTPESCEALKTAVADLDENVRSAAVKALAEHGSDAAKAVLLEGLQNDESPHFLAHLLDGLFELNVSLGAHELENLYEHRELHRTLLRFEGLRKDRLGIPKLQVALKSRARGTREAALTSLVAGFEQQALSEEDIQYVFSTPEYIEVLEQAIYDAMRPYGQMALKIVSILGDVHFAPMLLEAGAQQENIDDAVAMVKAMGDAACDVLILGFGRLGIEAKLLSLDIFVHHRWETSLPLQRELAMSEDIRLAEGAVESLGRFARTEDIQTLADSLSIHGEALAHAVTAALTEIGRSFPDDVSVTLRSLLGGEAEDAVWVRVLGELRNPADRDLVADAIRHTEPAVRSAAVDVASKWADCAVDDDIVFALVDESAIVRRSAARALRHRPSERTVAALAIAAQDADVWVTTEALGSLAILASADAEVALLEASKRAAAPVVLAALEGLVRCSSTKLADAVKVGARHADAEVVRESMLSTEHLDDDTRREVLQTGLWHRDWSVRLAACDVAERLKVDIPSETLTAVYEQEDEDSIRNKIESIMENRRRK